MLSHPLLVKIDNFYMRKRDRLLKLITRGGSLKQPSGKIDAKDKTIILQCSLPRSYEYLVFILTYGKEAFEVDDILAVLFAHEQRRKNNAGESSSRVIGVGRLIRKRRRMGHNAINVRIWDM